jgi:Holliday junction resolvase
MSEKVKKKVSEKWVKNQVITMLKDAGAYYFYPVANGYMQTGVPDIIACMHGEFIGIECKAGNNKPTVIQERNLAAIEESGGIALVINEDSLDLLRDVLSTYMEE